MRSYPSLIIALPLAFLLTGCASTDWDKADYTIKVQQDVRGAKAVPPECASWKDQQVDPLANDPLPQFGCATARNLAVMIEDPQDLLDGRSEGAADGVVSARSMELYKKGETKPLLDPMKAASGN